MLGTSTLSATQRHFIKRFYLKLEKKLPLKSLVLYLLKILIGDSFGILYFPSCSFYLFNAKVSLTIMFFNYIREKRVSLKSFSLVNNLIISYIIWKLIYYNIDKLILAACQPVLIFYVKRLEYRIDCFFVFTRLYRVSQNRCNPWIW